MSQAQPDNKILTAAVVIIGNEILTGRTLDKNTQHIAQKLSERGIQLAEVRVVQDIEEKIVKAVNELRAQVDYVFTTGGIGPTHDDITAESIAVAVGFDIEENTRARQILLNHYGEEDLTAARLRMARMPVGAELVLNPVSSAPGFKIENIYVMAGVPKIMQAMLDNILPTLGEGMLVYSNTVSANLPESELSDDLGKLQDKYPEIEIGSYPRFVAGNIGVSIVLRSSQQDILKIATREALGIVFDHGDTPEVIECQVPVDE